MRAVWIDGHGGLDVLRVGERPRPVIGPDDALVRVRACALNHLDVWVREGLPGLKVDFPHILGSDAAGVIEEIGEKVRGWVVGQPVLAAPGLSCGTCVYCHGGDDHL
ncbi:MAG TPA: alcohol dehydrogenase catalytic domain-containing protein, partial [Elusimicrobiota bacterium]|nr:alcohol dehydrogenase catalytic domain-containing protein [Elusimicrobiota bacterium]